MKKTGLGIIGLGRFGLNYLRTLNGIEDVEAVWACSTSIKKLQDSISKAIPKNFVKATDDYRKILKDKNVDAVVISSPSSTHYKIAKEAIMAGKHALVEKPLCLSAKHAKDLLKLSKSKNKVLMAGHLHLFNPGIQKLKQDIKAGLFGKIRHISIFHSGNGPVRTDMNAVWDFFPHSVSILLYLLEKNPIQVSVDGASFLKKGNEDIATMSLSFPNNVFALSTGTWLYPLKRLEVVVAGKNLYAVFDDYAKENKLKYFDSTPKIINGKAVIDDKGVKNIQISDSKPLANQLKYFLSCVRENEISINDAKSALEVTKILEFAQKSLKTGAKININL